MQSERTKTVDALANTYNLLPRSLQVVTRYLQTLDHDGLSPFLRTGTRLSKFSAAALKASLCRQSPLRASSPGVEFHAESLNHMAVSTLGLRSVPARGSGRFTRTQIAIFAVLLDKIFEQNGVVRKATVAGGIGQVVDHFHTLGDIQEEGTVSTVDCLLQITGR